MSVVTDFCVVMTACDPVTEESQTDHRPHKWMTAVS